MGRPPVITQAKSVTLRTYRYCPVCREQLVPGEVAFKLRRHYAHSECVSKLGGHIDLRDVVRDVMSASTRDAEHLVGYDPERNTAGGNCRTLDPLTCWVFWSPNPEILAKINQRIADVSRELMAELSQESGDPYSEAGFLSLAAQGGEAGQ